MRKANAALILLVSACQFASAQGASFADPAADRSQILNSVNEIARAYAARDPAPFERLYLENHTAVRGRPVFNLREQLIAMTQADSIVIRGGKRPEFETLRYESRSPEVYLYGRAAIVTAAKEHYWQYHGQKCLTRTQATELWVKIAEEWKFAASHTNTFECDPRPFYPIHPAVAALQSRSRPPANSDLEAERQVRELIRSLVAARASLDEPFEAVLNRNVAETFVSTDARGAVGRDRSILSAIQVPLPGRASVFRNQDDAVLIYGDAALYTFRLRSESSPPPDAPQQMTIFFARLAGRWLIVAAHATRNDD